MRTRVVLPWLLCMILAVPCLAAERVTLYLFASRTCMNCLREKEFLAKLQGRVPELDVRSFEVQFDPANAKLLARVAEAIGEKLHSVPVTFIGRSTPIVGYERDETTGAEIETRVRECVAHRCDDVIGPLVAGGGTTAVAPLAPSVLGPAGARVNTGKPAPPQGLAGGAAETTVALPLVGKTDLRTMPLVLLTVILGGLDSFNPCAFFVLFSLLGMLAHARSRARMLFIGGIFVFFSGIVYFVFMAAWLNVFLYIGQLQAITAGAGVVALCIAAINIKDFFRFKEGISLTIPESKKPGLFARMRALLHESSLPAMVLGSVVLALAANTYELLCTAGFPLVFTRILTLSRLGTVEYYLYLMLYNAVYVLPLAVVVAVFSGTLGSRKLSEAQGRTMKLVSGLMMLGLGAVVLFDPGLFNNLLVGLGLLVFALLVSMAIVAVERRRQTAGGVR